MPKMRTAAELAEILRGYHESRILQTALEMDVFTVVGEGGTAGEVAERLGAQARSMEMFLNALVAVGALEKSGGVFRTTAETGRYWTSRSEESQRAALMHSVNTWRAWLDLGEAVRAGGAVRTPGVEGGDAGWTESFIAAMHARAVVEAAGLVRTVGAAGMKRMLDVGGGSGAFAIGFAQANGELEAEVFDLPQVVGIAQRHIARAGLEARVKTRTGDLTRDEFGTGYDLILLSSICHMLSPEENLDLLRRCRRALGMAGRLVIRDFLLDEEKTSPKNHAIFSLTMLVATRGGASYSEAEYREWLGRAGFGRVVRPAPEADLLIGYADGLS